MFLPFLALSIQPKPADTFAFEADRLTAQMIQTFYSPQEKIWKPPTVPTSESVGTEGYTVWSCIVAWQAILEGARRNPAHWKTQIGPHFDVLEQYFDKADHVYCAWKYFPGNDDKFYDDNAWMALACIDAFEITGEARYLNRAIELFDKFIKRGWDSGEPGGFRWGTQPNGPGREDRTACSTASAALTALRIAPHRNDPTDLEWAKKSLDWIKTRLVSPQNLIHDGLHSPHFRVEKTTWTYNTGTTMAAALAYARQSGDTSYRDWAIQMGDAAIDRSRSLYDGAVKKQEANHWFDSTFFVQYLAVGLTALSKETADPKYADEVRRNAGYAMKHLRDKDGLYWRNMRLWTISPEHYQTYTQLTGQTTPPYSPDSSERSMSEADKKKPVAERPMVKTLLGNAGAARLFWLVAERPAL